LTPKSLVVAQWPSLNLIQEVAPGTTVFLGEHHVPTQHSNAVLIEQGGHKPRQYRPGPGPLTYFHDAAFIEIDDYYAVVQRIRHGYPDPQIVGQSLQVTECWNRPVAA
jgi:hypothetical protein